MHTLSLPTFCRSRLLAFGALALPAVADAESTGPVSLQWQGTISAVTAYPGGSLPAGIEEGLVLSGNLNLDFGQYLEETRILASHTYGSTYRFGGGLLNTLTAGGVEWRALGGDVTLTSYSYEDGQFFDVLGTTENSTWEAFPNSAGPATFGFSIGDDRMPLSLFEYDETGIPTLNLYQFNRGSGYLSTCVFDENGDPVGGYYIEFEVNAVTLEDLRFTAIPEPSSATLLSGILALAVFAGRRARKRSSGIVA